jgi:hypothetical protein
MTHAQDVDDRHVDGTTRFRCACGRSVAVPDDSRGADQRRCSRCRTRQVGPDDALHRIDRG